MQKLCLPFFLGLKSKNLSAFGMCVLVFHIWMCLLFVPYCRWAGALPSSVFFYYHYYFFYFLSFCIVCSILSLGRCSSIFWFHIKTDNTVTAARRNLQRADTEKGNLNQNQNLQSVSTQKKEIKIKSKAEFCSINCMHTSFLQKIYMFNFSFKNIKIISSKLVKKMQSNYSYLHELVHNSSMFQLRDR